MEVNRAEIEAVAIALGTLKSRCFLTGGASIPFYITDALEELPRVTLDIDVVVEISSAQEFRNEIEVKLRSQGFVNDMSEGAPICRWTLGSITVDIMPTDESILGFTNSWHREGASTLMPVKVSRHCNWRILSPPYALAAKCEAFTNRGAADPGSSSDLEDIVTLVNGRPSLLEEVQSAAPNCKGYLAS